MGVLGGKDMDKVKVGVHSQFTRKMPKARLVQRILKKINNFCSTSTLVLNNV